MTLRTKTLLIVGLVLSALLTLMFCESRQVLLARFSEVEREDSEAAAQRARMAIGTMLEPVRMTCREWAGRAQPILPSGERELDQAGMSVCAVFGADGEPTSLLSWDPVQHRAREFPKGLLEYIKRSGLVPGRPIIGADGVVVLPEGVLLLSVHPPLMLGGDAGGRAESLTRRRRRGWRR